MSAVDGRPRDIDCVTAVRRLWDHLDHALDVPAADEVERHLRTCAACSSHYAFARRMLDAIAEAAPVPPGAPELDATRRRVLEALAAEGFRSA
jgi:anti-sigma factor RsiW